MTLQIVGLVVMVVSFTLLVGWVYWPANKARFDASARLALDIPVGDEVDADGPEAL